MGANNDNKLFILATNRDKQTIVFPHSIATSRKAAIQSTMNLKDWRKARAQGLKCIPFSRPKGFKIEQINIDVEVLKNEKKDEKIVAPEQKADTVESRT